MALGERLPDDFPKQAPLTPLQISTGAGVLVGEVAAGLLMKPIGYTKYQLIVTTVMITAFSGALAAVNQHRQSYGIAVSPHPKQLPSIVQAS